MENKVYVILNNIIYIILISENPFLANTRLFEFMQVYKVIFKVHTTYIEKDAYEEYKENLLNLKAQI